MGCAETQVIITLCRAKRVVTDSSPNLTFFSFSVGLEVARELKLKTSSVITNLNTSQQATCFERSSRREDS